MNIRKKACIGTVAVLLALSAGMTAMAKTANFQDASAKGGNEWAVFNSNWPSIQSNTGLVNLTPGADSSQINFAWYSNTQETPAVRVSAKSDMSGFTTFSGQPNKSFTSSNGSTYYSSKVTTTGLQANTTYYYTYYSNGAWSAAPTSFTTGNPSNFSFLWAGDPQIGSSQGDVNDSGATLSEAQADINDAFNWNATLTTALQAHPGFNFVLSAGDQCQYSTGGTNALPEQEYAGFAFPSLLRSLPVATTIGNHDSKHSDLQYHYNDPNTVTASAPSPAGNDYYYSYGNALFIVLDTNNLNMADHQNTLKAATQAYPNAKWRIVSFHQDVYGSGNDHSDSDGIVLRTQITPLMKAYDIDVVLNGHDHSYSRSYDLIDNGQTHTNFSSTDTPAGSSTAISHDDYLKANECYTILNPKNADGSYVDQTTSINPQGTYYFTSDSATGSKYYNLITPQQDYVAKRWQNFIPTYSIINMTDTGFTINTYETDTGSKIDDTFTIVKSADKTSLQALVQTAQAVDKSKYTNASYATLQTAIANAQAVIGNPAASSTDVSNAYGQLQQAYSNLVLASAPTATQTGLNTGSTTSAASSAAGSTVNNPNTGAAGNMYSELALLGMIGAGVVLITSKIKKRFK